MAEEGKRERSSWFAVKLLVVEIPTRLLPFELNLHEHRLNLVLIHNLVPA